jgi:hypothetical protein
MAWYCARMAKMIAVGPAGKKSKTPQLKGLKIAVKTRGGMMEVRSPETRMNDCTPRQQICF